MEFTLLRENQLIRLSNIVQSIAPFLILYVLRKDIDLYASYIFILSLVQLIFGIFGSNSGDNYVKLFRKFGQEFFQIFYVTLLFDIGLFMLCSLFLFGLVLITENSLMSWGLFVYIYVRYIFLYFRNCFKGYLVVTNHLVKLYILLFLEGIIRIAFISLILIEKIDFSGFLKLDIIIAVVTTIMIVFTAILLLPTYSYDRKMVKNYLSVFKGVFINQSIKRLADKGDVVLLGYVGLPNILVNLDLIKKLAAPLNVYVSSYRVSSFVIFAKSSHRNSALVLKEILSINFIKLLIIHMAYCASIFFAWRLQLIPFFSESITVTWDIMVACIFYFAYITYSWPLRAFSLSTKITYSNISQLLAPVSLFIALVVTPDIYILLVYLVAMVSFNVIHWARIYRIEKMVVC